MTTSNDETVAPQHAMQIELEGLIKLLAQNLYANPDVFLREMIQNSHDAIKKRMHLGRISGLPTPAPEIRISCDPARRTLSVSDNGAGLSLREIHDYLATIGRSGTDEFRRGVESRNRTATVNLIGQFGIGLLSAFIVATKVEVVTKSQDDEAYRWLSNGSKYYSIDASQRTDVGTTTILHLGLEHSRYVDYELLRGIVRTYANVIGLPVFLGNETTPCNDVDAPWHKAFSTESERHEASYVFWEQRFRAETSLDVWPVDLRFDYSDDQQEPRQGVLRGVLGITDRHIPGINSRGTVDVFISRMFIASGHSDILPSWARFIQGVIECNELSPNAARDDVVINDCFTQARMTLGRHILAHLVALFNNDRHRFTDIMRWHSYHVLAMCAQPEHDDFFRQVADIVPLASDQGFITIPQYQERAAKDGAGKTVYYISEAGTTSQYYLLCKARGISVFDATQIFAETFLQRYAATWPDRVTLKRVDVSGSDVIFERVSESVHGNFESMAAELRRIPGVTPRVSRFKPTNVPVLLTESRDSESRRELENIAQNVTLPTSIRETVSRHLSESRGELILHLNADNPTVQKLAARRDLGDAIGRAALTSLYNNAVMLHSRNITPENIQTMFEQYNGVVELLIGEADARAALELESTRLHEQLASLTAPSGTGAPAERERFLTCFVAMPFALESERLFSALRQVLEDTPFFWRVTRADEQQVDARLWKNVELQMLSAHCFIAEVSDQNPNVMIEIGRMEVLARPLLLLKRTGSLPLPADLRERLFIEYADNSEDLVSELREHISANRHFVDQRAEPYLSEVLLARVEGLSSRACQLIAREYRACHEFIAADPIAVATRLGLSHHLVRAAQDGVRELLSRAGIVADPRLIN